LGYTNKSKQHNEEISTMAHAPPFGNHISAKCAVKGSIPTNARGGDNYDYHTPAAPAAELNDTTNIA
jgi:hypothetical protein